MYLSRFFAILFVLIFSTSPLVEAAEITGAMRSSYMLGLRSPVRLPVFYDDSSLLRFVSRTTPLSDRGYAPTDLISISGSLINQA